MDSQQRQSTKKWMKSRNGERQYEMKREDDKDQIEKEILRAKIVKMVEKKKNLMSARILAEMIGDMVELPSESKDCWGRFIRVKVKVNVLKPLKRFLKLQLDEFKFTVIIPLQYERFCYVCGLIGHLLRECTDVAARRATLEGSETKFGSWIRASTPAKSKVGSVPLGIGGAWNPRLLGTMKILSWNVRDLGNLRTFMALRKDDECARVVEKEWEEFGVIGSVEGLRVKLAWCASKLETWGKDKFGSLSKAIRLKQKKLDELFERADWLLAEDRNSKFFHTKASAMKKEDTILRLVDRQGKLQESEDGVINTVCDYFEVLFKSNNPSQEDLNEATCGLSQRPSVDMVDILSGNFVKEDVKIAIFRYGIY
ncbi:hypothetical protein Dsin_019148 [Dipteronia sinensis]|uniref:CCHC-type domain-containing protein n=1 Tax=Dipteronia sinensis TaxID=43782 RepID=A0AAE0A778_9ROSI|nr:hypothetical protein Dsin_019148 [Dipteronia sinensis]